MGFLFLIFNVLIVFPYGQRMKYLEFPHNRTIPDDIERPQHFSVLDNSNLQELPEKFSICSSLHIEYNRGFLAHFVILTDDHSFWLIVGIHQDLNAQNYALWVDKIGPSILYDKPLKLRPWSWSHLCASVNLLNGIVAITFNGERLNDTTLPASVLVRSNKPKNLKNRLVFGDYTYRNRVYQSESSISNVNIYGRLLTEKEMVEFTGSGACSQTGDYLAWDDMLFKLNGDVRIKHLTEDVCGEENMKDSNFLFPEYFDWPTCMSLCQKMHKGRDTDTKVDG